MEGNDEKFLNTEKIPVSVKFIVPGGAFAVGGGQIAGTCIKTFLVPENVNGVKMFPIPFSNKLVSLPIVGRCGALIGSSLFIGGLVSGAIKFECLNLDTLLAMSK